MSQEEKVNIVPVGTALPAFGKRAIEIQSEVSEKLIEASHHCLDQIQVELTEALEFLRKFSDNTTAAEKVGALKEWMKGATERGARNATFAMETARALADIEVRLFARVRHEKDAA